MVRGVHGALVGGARGGPAVGLAGGARHVPGVPRALLPAGRVPGRHLRAHRRLARRPRPPRRRPAAAAAVAAPAPAALPRAPPPPLLPPSQRLSGASIFLQVLVSTSEYLASLSRLTAPLGGLPARLRISIARLEFRVYSINVGFLRVLRQLFDET